MPYHLSHKVPPAGTLKDRAKAVLAGNSIGGLIIPAQGLYPHRVLWDSCFIAIGLSHYDIKLAQHQIRSFLSAQWSNGMVPHIIFNPAPKYWWARRNWRSWVSPLSVPGLATSGVTQPPLLAEATVRVGKHLSTNERINWYKSNFEALVKYHSWLYEQRATQQSDLVTLIHPWETGMDNTPPWLLSLRRQRAPWWLKLMVQLRLDKVADHFRVDGHYVDYHQRSTTVEALRLYAAQRLIIKDKFDSQKILEHPTFAIEDLAYNSIFIRANVLLREIAQTINQPLPDVLLKRMAKTETSLNDLWDKAANTYYSRNIKYDYFMKEDSVAALLPLYSGAITKERAQTLVKKLKSNSEFNANYPVPSVPPTSNWFQAMRYWQGPTWININWLLIDGLRRYGFKEEAKQLSKKSIELVRKSGFYEYFNPLNGEPAGVDNFSWTAALIIDLLS